MDKHSNKLIDLAVQRFIETFDNKDRNNDPILTARIKDLNGRQFEEYVERTQNWVEKQA